MESLKSRHSHKDHVWQANFVSGCWRLVKEKAVPLRPRSWSGDGVNRAASALLGSEFESRRPVSALTSLPLPCVAS